MSMKTQRSVRKIKTDKLKVETATVADNKTTLPISFFFVYFLFPLRAKIFKDRVSHSASYKKTTIYSPL